MKLNRTKKGFTIVELVIVIAVIGVLSAILIPTFANLTNDARAAANKQQVADAYTAYLVEAVNDKYDGLYSKAHNAEDSTYAEANLTIAQKTQDQVALNLNGTWYKYDAEKGWATYTPDSAPTVLVVKDAVAAKTYAVKNDTTYSVVFAASGTTTADQANKQLSTFNGVLVYVK